MQREVKRFFNSAFLKKNQVHYRDYQNNIVNRCINKNSLVVLPTGLGKTIIGILLITNCLKKYSKAKIIILAPTRPLVSQHKASCVKFLNIDLEEITSFTGRIPPERRIFLFKNSRIIISTPQVIKNDLMRGRYDLTTVSLIIFDEAHKTKGNYAYNFISREYIDTCSDPLILGLTASPGKDNEHIQQICDNLYIENILFKNYHDKDVKDYIYDIEIITNLIDLSSELIELSTIWYNLFEIYLKFFVKNKLIAPNKRYYSKLDFLGISRDLTLSLRFENGYDLGLSEEEYLECLYYKSPRIIDVVKENKLEIPSVFSYCSSCISVLHAKDLIETQDISLFKSFLDKIKYKASMDILSAKRIANSKHFNHINSVIENTTQPDLSHPKIKKIISIIKEEIEEFNNKKIIIFTQYREMAELLKKNIRIEFKDQLEIEKFIGQSTKIDDCGFPQHIQIEILQKFREGQINILIATSVAEEGLDIPNVDAIICYEPVPSEIRLIQRRGRTGRNAPGRCYILITEETVDVPFYNVAKRKENSMNSVLSKPEQLKLIDCLERKRIDFSLPNLKFSELTVVTNYRERKEIEQQVLASRTIEDILTKLDDFCNSEEYKRFKNVTHFSDLVKMDKEKLKRGVLKIKGKTNNVSKKPKRYINRNVKTLINLAKTYGDSGKIDFIKFQELAEEEDIVEKKFRTHFNQACYLGYLKKDANGVKFIKDYD